MSQRYAKGENNTLSVVSTAQQEQSVSEAQLQRTLRSLVAQKDRETKRLDGEIAQVQEMIAACIEHGVKGEDTRLPSVQREVALPPMPKKSLGKRMWSFLTKPRMVGS